MRSASVSALYYISEAGGSGGFGGKPASAGASGTLSSPTSSKNKPFQTRVRPLIDTDVMGEGGKGMSIDVAKGALSTMMGPMKAMAGLGSLFGGNLVTALTTDVQKDLAANAVDRYKKDVRAQQEAVYNMSNVDNFYKNLGMAGRIPLLPPEENMLVNKIISTLRGK